MIKTRGYFITFEGCEGCGKSTQSRILYNRLRGMKINAVLTREPGGTPLGNAIRKLLKDKKDISINALAELLLFNSCRTQLVNDIIRPALASGKVVICDRFTDSTVVYQGYARGLDTKMVSIVNDIATGGLIPDLTVLLDTDPEQGIRRKQNRANDRFETEDLAFHNKVRNGYMVLSKKDPERWLLIKSGQSISNVSDLIWERVAPALEKLKLTSQNPG